MNYRIDKYKHLTFTTNIWGVYCLKCNRRWANFNARDLKDQGCCSEIPQEAFDKRDFLNKLQRYT